MSHSKPQEMIRSQIEQELVRCHTFGCDPAESARYKQLRRELTIEQEHEHLPTRWGKRVLLALVLGAGYLLFYMILVTISRVIQLAIN